MNLHDQGYTYTGPNNLYQLTWIEIFRIFEATEIREKQLELARDNVRRSDYEKFRQFDAKMKDKYRG